MRFRTLMSAACIMASAAVARPDSGADSRDAARQFCTRPSVPGPASSQVRSGSSTPLPLNPGFDDGEFLIDTNIAWVPVSGRQYLPAAAFDGTNFLVVWADERNGYHDIYGARVSQSGTVLDPGGIAISTAADHQWYPAAAFDGESFLVVWTDFRNGSDCDVYGARVTTAGAVLDTAGIVISTAANSQYVPAAAFDGENCLVVWTDERSGPDRYDIYGCRVSPAGVVLEPAGIPVSTAANGQHDPSLAVDGTNLLVVWSDFRNCPDTTDIYCARVTSTGVVLDTAGIPICTAADGQGFSATAFDGNNYLVAWTDWRAGYTPDIYGCRVSPNGTVLDSSGIAISTAVGNNGQSTSAVAFDGINFLVAWEDDWNIAGARVSPGGVVLDTSAIVISTSIYWELHPVVASDGTRCLVAWGDFIDSGGWACDVVGTRVTRDGVVLEPEGIVISTAANRQEGAAVASDGTDYLVAWADVRGEYDADICAVRVSQAGALLDSASIVVSTEGNSRRPAGAFDGTNCLLVWERWRTISNIRAARVSPTGQVLDTSEIVISTQSVQYYPAVAFDGENYFVVWTIGSGTNEPGIYGARVSPAGQVLDTACFVLWNGRCGLETPAVAFDGTNYLVVCRDNRDLRNPEIYGARVSPSGEVLDPDGIRISSTAGSPWDPAVAFDGANFLVVWVEDRVYGARVSPAGTVLDPQGFAVSATRGGIPAVAFDGTDYLVVWADSRNTPDTSDIYGARVRPDGTVFAEGPVVIQAGRQRFPALARGAGSQLFLVYQGWAGSVGSKAYNTYRIWGKLSPLLGVAESPRSREASPQPGPTIVRGVLRLQVDTRQYTGHRVRAELLDISGRKVMDLLSGENDIRLLSPGIYFVRAVGGEPSAASCRKVIVTR